MAKRKSSSRISAFSAEEAVAEKGDQRLAPSEVSACQHKASEQSQWNGENQNGAEPRSDQLRRDHAVRTANGKSQRGKAVALLLHGKRSRRQNGQKQRRCQLHSAKCGPHDAKQRFELTPHQALPERRAGGRGE